MQAFQSP